MYRWPQSEGVVLVTTNRITYNADVRAEVREGQALGYDCTGFPYVVRVVEFDERYGTTHVGLDPASPDDLKRWIEASQQVAQ